MSIDITPEDVTELGKQLGEFWLAGLTVDDLLARFGPEEVLPHFKPADRLAGLTLPERLADFKPEELEDYLKQLKKQQH
jgi:hypothetical protein